jgi:hypothetical protein
MKKTILFLLLLITVSLNAYSQQAYVSIEGQAAIGSELIDNAARTVIDSNGNRLVFGTFSEAVDFDLSESEFILEPLGSPDLFLASYDDEGNFNWAFKIGRIALTDGMIASGLALDADNNPVISGAFSLTVDFDPSSESSPLTSVQGLDGFLAKYDSDGQFMWSKQFGSVGSDVVSALAIDNEDNHLIGVRYNEEIDLDPSDENEVLSAPVGGLDASVILLDQAGEYVWDYSINATTENEIVTALTVNDDGRIALGAATNGITSGIPVQSMMAAVLEPDGSEVWSYDFQNQGQSNIISHLAYSEDGNSIYLGGRIQEDTDFDPSVDEEILSPLFADPFISKHSAADGSLAWAKYVESGSTGDYCAGIHEDNGVVYLAGSYDVLATFVPGDFSTQVPTNGAADVFVAVYDAESGEFITADTFGGTGGERANDAYFAGELGLAIAGQFNSSLELVSGESIASQGFEDGFVAFFTYIYNLSAGAELSESDVSLYPVPSSDHVYVQFGNMNAGKFEVKLINIIGQTVLAKTYDNSPSRIKLDISNLKQGIYLMEIRVENSSITKRLIKQ